MTPETDSSVDTSAPEASTRGSGHIALIGSAITAYAVLDAYTLGVGAFLLAAYTNALVVFFVLLAVQLIVNLAAGSWIDRNWDVWSAEGIGQRFEAKVQKARTGRTGALIVGLIERGSDIAFAVAAAIANAVVVVGLARVLTGKPLGHQRIVAAALGYSIFFAAIFSLLGWAFRDFIVNNL